MSERYDEMMRHLVDAENALDRARYHAALLGEGLTAPPPVTDPFDGGATYPPAATLSLHPAFVAPGATVAHVEVTLDGETANTVHGYIRCLNGTGFVERDFMQTVTFLPGGPLRQTVSFAVKPMREGQFVTVVQANAPGGGLRGTKEIAVTCRTAEATAALPAQPKPPAFAPIGELVYDRKGSEIAITDEGSETSFATELPHGRTQPANDETGYYGELKYGHIRVEGDCLVLETKPAPEPIEVKEDGPTTIYRLLSAILSGHKYPDVWFRHGAIEWEARMPNSPGSWPSPWLLSLKEGADGVIKSKWPFEIDPYEGFNNNPSWNPSSSLSANLHGGVQGSNKRAWTRPAANMRMEHFGLAPTLDSEFHRFATTIDGDWIRDFVDGVEVMSWRNPFDSAFGWHPLIQLTTQADPDVPMTGKNTFELRRLKVWRL